MNMRQTLHIVKVGGAIVEAAESLQALLIRFQSLPGAKILIHGGGRTATDIATRLGLPTTMIAGRRVTDPAMLDVVTMVYGGLVNKRIVAQLSSHGSCALGLTGADMQVVRAQRRAPHPIDYGCVGDVEAVDAARLSSLLSQGVIPVIAPLTYDGHGGLLNTNADTIASEVAKALAADYEVTLTYCFELPGVLQDPTDPSTRLPHLDQPTFDTLVDQGIITGGMIPKITNALQAISHGVHCVVITQAQSLGDISQGTYIT